MKFVLIVNCNNASFCEGDDATTQSAGPELARILKQVARQIENGAPFDYFQTIRDLNGNDVGRYAMKGEA